MFVIMYRRLEAGTFRFPATVAASVTIRAAPLMLLDGVDLDNVKHSQRYRRPVSTGP